VVLVLLQRAVLFFTLHWEQYGRNSPAGVVVAIAGSRHSSFLGYLVFFGMDRFSIAGTILRTDMSRV
jgi:hypothetical protein